MKPSHETIKPAYDLITAFAVFLLLSLCVCLLIQRNVAAQTGRGVQTQDLKPVAGYRLSGPYSHKNLTIFLVHGRELLPGHTFLTLQEALAQKKVIVYETKDVNELAIRNVSNQDVYVQAGDIVRGGDQDRMISVDFIVPPRSKRMPIAAFCVESGRWSRRGSEGNSSFSVSENYATTKDLKLAAKSANSQSAVWENVAVVQQKLSQNVAEVVNVSASPSSLELSLENAKVKESTNDYVRALSGILQGKSDVIGYVFAINGEVNSADVYASRALFLKLWPKLLKANATEALAELEEKNPPKPISDDDVHGFLTEAENAAPTEKAVTTRVNLVTREDAKNAFFETRDRAKGAWIHRNYIKK